MAKALRYRLHWASGRTHPKLKWVIYDWHLKCPCASTETRMLGRKLCDFLNAEYSALNSPK